MNRQENAPEPKMPYLYQCSCAHVWRPFIFEGHSFPILQNDSFVPPRKLLLILSVCYYLE